MDTYTVKQLLNSIIDENISIRLDRYDKIVVRTKFSASHGGNVSQHGTSIKVDISNMEYQVEIPTKSYLGLSKQCVLLMHLKRIKSYLNRKLDLLSHLYM